MRVNHERRNAFIHFMKTPVRTRFTTSSRSVFHKSIITEKNICENCTLLVEKIEKGRSFKLMEYLAAQTDLK